MFEGRREAFGSSGLSWLGGENVRLMRGWEIEANSRGCFAVEERNLWRVPSKGVTK